MKLSLKSKKFQGNIYDLYDLKDLRDLRDLNDLNSVFLQRLDVAEVLAFAVGEPAVADGVRRAVLVTGGA